jgi:hypothetical protein
MGPIWRSAQTVFFDKDHVRSNVGGGCLKKMFFSSATRSQVDYGITPPLFRNNRLVLFN